MWDHTDNSMLVQTEPLSLAGDEGYMAIIPAPKHNRWAGHLGILLCPKPTHILHVTTLSWQPPFLYPQGG